MRRLSQMAAIIAAASWLIAAASPAHAQQEAVPKFADAEALGAAVTIDRSNAAGCQARIEPPLSIDSASLVLDCSEAPHEGGERSARYSLFERMSVAEPWIIIFSVVRPFIAERVVVHRKPVVGTRNLWTEVTLKAQPAQQLRAQIRIVARVISDPVMACGTGGRPTLRSGPAGDLTRHCPPCPGPPCPGCPAPPCLPCTDVVPAPLVSSTVFECASNSDCDSGYRCILQCGGHCVPR